jgi:transcriptional regulator with XRE-family HTH domain
MTKHDKDARSPRPHRPGSSIGKPKSLGLALALLRSLKGKERSEVARALGVEENQIARRESLRKLLQALETTEEELGLFQLLFALRARTSASLRAAGPAATELEQIRDSLFAEVLDLVLPFVAYRLVSQPAGEAFADLVRNLSRRNRFELEPLLLQEDDDE